MKMKIHRRSVAVLTISIAITICKANEEHRSSSRVLQGKFIFFMSLHIELSSPEEKLKLTEEDSIVVIHQRYMFVYWSDIFSSVWDSGPTSGLWFPYQRRHRSEVHCQYSVSGEHYPWILGKCWKFWFHLSWTWTWEFVCSDWYL